MRNLDGTACNIAFGKFIQEKRKSKQLSQMEMASRVGLTQSYYSRIESGDRNVYLNQMICIFQELDVDPMEFFSRYYF